AVGRARKAFTKRKVDVTLPAKLPLIRGDAALLEQVIFNLLDNAHKYSEPQSVSRISLTTTAANIVVAVSDSGTGIPRDSLEKVFEKFYRVAGSDGRAPGTGLGLSICAGIVKGMGGSIIAESPIDRGQGSRITVTLPLETAPASHAGKEASP
ncbi:MAG: ATP-binding protein, partial [Hyphomicrobium sp.]